MKKATISKRVRGDHIAIRARQRPHKKMRPLFSKSACHEWNQMHSFGVYKHHFLGLWFISFLVFFCTFESNLRYIFGILKHEERFCFCGYLFGRTKKILSILERHISISGMFRWTNSFWCRRFESPLEMKICSFTFFCNTTDGRKRSSTFHGILCTSHRIVSTMTL